MNALVELFNNQPMTTSLAIADGVNLEHASVIKLVRKYQNHLQEFNPIGFESRKGEKLPQGGYGKSTEFARLSEGQAMFILTLQRNTEKVVVFKKALVQAFLELREQATSIPHRHDPLSTTHRADILVSADRTFRSILRAARVAGVKTPQALRCANRITLQETGIDMLKYIDVEIQEPVVNVREIYAQTFMRDWQEQKLPYPFVPCHSTDLYKAYVLECKKRNIFPDAITTFIYELTTNTTLKKKRIRISNPIRQITAIVPDGYYSEFDSHIEAFAQSVAH